MRPYRIQLRRDGLWEAVLEGSRDALLLFESPDDVAAFELSVTRWNGGAISSDGHAKRMPSGDGQEDGD